MGALGWDGPAFAISALARRGTEDLCAEIMAWLEMQRQDEDGDDAEHDSR